MLSIFISIQYFGLFVLLFEILYLLTRKNTQQKITLLFVLLSVLVNFYGYLLELTATTQETAIQAVKMSYLGKPFIIFGLFFFSLSYFRIKIPKHAFALLIAFHVFIVFLVLTCEQHTLFYSSIDYTLDGYFPHLVLGHGIFYWLNTLLMVVYFLVILFFSLLRLLEHGNGIEKAPILYILSIDMVTIGSFIIFLSKKTGGFDTVSLAYLFDSIVLLICMVRYNVVDAVSLAKDNMIDEFADGLLVVNRENKILYTNQMFQKIYPDFETLETSKLIEQINENYQKRSEFCLNEHYYEIVIRDITNHASSKSVMYVFRDVTDTHEYMQQLEKQTLLANQANQAKSDFLANMSHEIRTPINAVLGMNEMILRETKENAIKEYASNIKGSGESLLSLINDILDFSKIESGKMEIIPGKYSISSIINDVYNMTFMRADSKGLLLKTDVDPTLPSTLFGDEVRIRQILINLLTNAVKYTQTGEINLKINWEQVDEENAILIAAVSDTGIGIAKENIHKLFDSFKRVDEQQNKTIEGTGLGLSITKQLLDLMNATITVESEYKKGSTFTVRIPQVIISDKPIGHFHARIEKNTDEYTALFEAPEAKILVVDDIATNLRVFENLLKETKIQIDTAISGKRCLKMIQKRKYHMIFMDHMMPEMDGIETLKEMKKMTDHPNKDTPVIMLTANAIQGAEEEYLDMGFCAYVSKPIKSKELEETIFEHLPKNLLQNINFKNN